MAKREKILQAERNRCAINARKKAIKQLNWAQPEMVVTRKLAMAQATGLSTFKRAERISERQFARTGLM